MFSLAARPIGGADQHNHPASPSGRLRPDQLIGLTSGVIPLPVGKPLPPGMENHRLANLHGTKSFSSSFSRDQRFALEKNALPSGDLAASLDAAASGTWSVVTSPNGGDAPTSLSAATCVSASDCWAVGRTEIGQTYANTALMRWDGNSWNIVPSPSVEKVTDGLVDITCVSSSSCWAVGYTITFETVQVQTLTLHWDGSSWSIIPSPNVGTGFSALYGVACSSDSDCWAAGFSNGGSAAQTLIERWDGNAWTVQSSPNVGSQSNVLNGITCLSASYCQAVGYTGMAGAKNSLVMSWDGTTWTASALPNQLTAEENTLYSVTCNSTADCWAVGDSYDGTAHQTLIESWDGTSWMSAITPNGGLDNYLYHVACDSTSDCWAVGNSSNATADPELFDQDLILHWNGTVWLLSVPPTSEASAYANDLSGVACVSGSECWAVGSIQPAGSGRPSILNWDGTLWTSVTAPDVPALPSNFLEDVTCNSQSDCWAAGFDFYGVVARSLTMHWDGASWGIIPSPNTAADRSNYLDAITCLSSSDCWTVGSSSDTLGLENQALSMHWDGTAWSDVNPAPVDTSQAAETTFEGVACVTTSNCWAVGFSLIQDYQALIEQWNGTAWVLIPTPPQQNVPTMNSILYGVACTSASDCTAVGVQWSSALTGNGLYQTLVDHWDGTSWSAVTSQNTSPNEDNILSAVTCASASDCWAVGSSDSYSQALIEQWNGTSWNIVPSFQAGSILNAVTCVSSSDCWAAGPYYTPNPPAHTYFEHWDGNAWTQVASPNASPTESNNLAGIACASSSGCWAVGEHWLGGSTQSLILRYAPAALPSNIVSRKTHGDAGTFDIDLTNATGIECRSGGLNGNYTLVFTFANSLTNIDGATITNGTGSVASSSVDSNDAHNYIVNLTGVGNDQTITVNLNNVSDSAGDFSSTVSASMGLLIGDVNASGVVDSGDVFLVRQQTGQSATQSNFREDVNASGLIDSGDVFLTRQQTGTSLP